MTSPDEEKIDITKYSDRFVALENAVHELQHLVTRLAVSRARSEAVESMTLPEKTVIDALGSPFDEAAQKVLDHEKEGYELAHMLCLEAAAIARGDEEALEYIYDSHCDCGEH